MRPVRAAAGPPLLLAFASVSERKACAPAALLDSFMQWADGPACARVAGLAAASWPAAASDPPPRGLVSAGVAGGLAPEARPGTLLLPRQVLTRRGHKLDVDPHWHARLYQALSASLPVLTAPLLGDGPLVPTAEAKRALGRDTGAGSIDMESALLADWACRAQLPFVVLRVVLDTVEDNLPPWTASALRPDGRTAYGPLLARLLARPRGLIELVSTARAFGATTRRWREAAELAGPALLPPGGSARPGAG